MESLPKIFKSNSGIDLKNLAEDIKSKMNEQDAFGLKKMHTTVQKVKESS